MVLYSTVMCAIFFFFHAIPYGGYLFVHLFALSSEGVIGEGVVGRECSFTPPRGKEGSRVPPPPVQQQGA
jgi:hypothetical protein